MEIVDLTTKDSFKEIGNILRSSQTLKTGETILQEPPLITGPNHADLPVCLECCLVNLDDEKCAKCSWALCKTCQALNSKKWHSEKECQLLKSISVQYYPLVFHLRLVQEALADSEKWQKVKNLQDHCDKISSSEEWQVFHNQVIPMIQKLHENASKSLILKCIGITCVNAIGIDKNGRRGRALFEKAVLASHNCMPNAIHTIHPTDFWIRFTACKEISLDEEVTISYVPLVLGEPSRRQHIMNEWCFQCTCLRCSSANEDLMSEMFCLQCKQGKLVYEHPMGTMACWKCNDCAAKIDEHKVQKMLNKATNDLKAITNFTNDLSLRLEHFFTQNKQLGQFHYLKLICIRNWMALNKSGDFLGQNRRHLSESMLKVIQKNGGQFSDWAEFLYKDLVVTLLQELPSVPLEGKSMQTALIKAYKKQLERCQQLHSF